MLSGTDWIPTEWREVQDYNCLIQMTELLMADNKRKLPRKKLQKQKLKIVNGTQQLLAKCDLLNQVVFQMGKMVL